MNFKLACDILNSEDFWVVLIRERVMRKTNFINHHIFSSVWSSAKTEIHHVLNNSSGCIGNEESTSLGLIVGVTLLYFLMLMFRTMSLITLSTYFG